MDMEFRKDVERHEMTPKIIRRIFGETQMEWRGSMRMRENLVQIVHSDTKP